MSNDFDGQISKKAFNTNGTLPLFKKYYLTPTENKSTNSVFLTFVLQGTIPVIPFQ